MVLSKARIISGNSLPSCMHSPSAGNRDSTIRPSIIDALDFDTMKTKNMVDFMKAIKVDDSALVVLGGKNENVEKASRNLPTVKTAFVNTINVFDILADVVIEI